MLDYIIQLSASVAQLVEHSLRKREVVGSIPIRGLQLKMANKIKIHVIANAKKVEVIRINENDFKIKIDAIAEKGKANKRLIEILSEYFNISKTKIIIVSGEKSHDKLIEILN